jgi:glutamyl-tRNA synthetase
LKIDEGPGNKGNLGPYRQSERKDIYKKYAEKLISSGNAYYAFDTPGELESMREKLKAAKVATPQYNAITRETMTNSLTLSADKVEDRLAKGEPYVIRIKVPRNEEIKVNDKIRGWVQVHSSKIDDKVIFKSDGMPTYHLANVVDDHLMEISHVIRGEEWLPSTPIHVLLYKYLGWENEMPQFAHLPLLLKPDGNGKLSKRDGDRLGFPVFPLEWENPETKAKSSGYREMGYFPEAFINIIAFLGWNPGTSQEVFSMDELIGAFSLERVGKAGAKFDFDKALWYNQSYLRKKPVSELAKLFHPLLKEKNIAAKNDYIEKACGLLKERARFIKDFMEGIYLFQAPASYDQKVIEKKWKAETPQIMNDLSNLLSNIDVFTPDNIEKEFLGYLEQTGIGVGSAMPNLRLLLTGIGAGPSVFEIASLLGKEETINRIQTGLEKL